MFRILVTLFFTGKNVFRILEAGGRYDIAKNTVYRFLNSVHTNWHRFLLLLSSRVISQELEPLIGAANMKLLIPDDTLYRCYRSKYVEILSQVFDHTDNRYYRGFSMLTLGRSDGISFLPVPCAILASSKEKNRLVPLRTDLDRQTNGSRRRREGIRKATDVLVEIVAEATASGIQASSSCPATDKEIGIFAKMLDLLFCSGQRRKGGRISGDINKELRTALKSESNRAVLFEDET